MEGMSSEQLSWHLPGKWSAAQVLEHLYLTYTGTTKGLEKVLTRGAPLATKPSMAQRVLTFVVVRLRPHTCRTRGPRNRAAEGAAGGAGAKRDLGKARGDGRDRSRGVKPASGATSSCSTTRFWVR